MTLVVLGANGRTGRLVVREALDRGETVTAVVRDDAKRPTLEHENLRVAVGDPCDPAFLSDVFAGQEAVISTLGGRLPTRQASSVYWRSAEAMVTAAESTGVRTLAVTSSALLFRRSALMDVILSVIARRVVQSAERMEDTLGRSGLNVIVARCGFLTDAEEPRYRAAERSLPENGASVSRLGVAHFMLDQVKKSGSGLQIYGVSSPV